MFDKFTDYKINHYILHFAISIFSFSYTFISCGFY
jgi:hypothetical protein